MNNYTYYSEKYLAIIDKMDGARITVGQSAMTT